ncbi:hypothetical protein L1987_15142 [Smallanthus sonchifolius]|uniref:Uncharacterized protein n=1 Tax=Smallanthus sonchifolius TaxID=185202 RepID=A0ACB9J597_9ASTR|nr:hypothetical protein L1987_15142 [Smallanthus sonchifolius]
MDSYSPSSLVYRPGAESNWEEDIRSPVYRSPPPPAARPRFDVRADWARDTGPRLRTPRSPPLRDLHLVPDPYHSNPWVRHTMTPTSAMGIPIDDVHQYVRTSEFERQRMEHKIRHDLQEQRMDSLVNQLSQIDYPNNHSGARLGDYLPSSGKLPETLAEISIYCL